jgi:hypothetical protein
MQVKTYRTRTLPVVLYGSETWLAKLSEEHGFRMCQNWALRKILGPEMRLVTGEWKKLHNAELHGLYSSINIIPRTKRRMGWAEHVARLGERINARTIVVVKSNEGQHLET